MAITISGDGIPEASLQVSNAPTNGQFLSAQSANAGGLTWAASAGGGGAMEFISKTTISSAVASVTITGLTAYPRYKIYVSGMEPTTQSNLYWYLTNSSGTAYTDGDYGNYLCTKGATAFDHNSYAYGELTGVTYASYDTSMELLLDETADGLMVSLTGTTTDRANTTGTAPMMASNVFSTYTDSSNIAVGGIKFAASTGNLNKGTIIIYGIKDS